MAEYTLTYFDFSGSRGEECRLALFVAGFDFEDRRISHSEWQALKASTPFGSLPVLERAGKPALAQSGAILAYIGRAAGLHPTDPWEAARHEAVIAAAEELRCEVNATGRIQDPEEKRRAREALATGSMLAWGERLERQVRGPFVGGDQLQVADIKVFQVLRAYRLGVLDHIPKTVMAGFQKLEAHHQAVAAHPKIAEWCARAST